MKQDVGVRNVPELRDFGRELQQLGSEMYEIIIKAQQKLYYVSEGWNDENNEIFKSTFEENVNQIKKMSEEFAEYNNYIQRICAPLDEYTSIRM